MSWSSLARNLQQAKPRESISPTAPSCCRLCFRRDGTATLGTDSFVARYRLAYGTAPGAMAATGYHAARRLDVAIRPLDGVIPRAALEDAWRSTEFGLPWELS